MNPMIREIIREIAKSAGKFFGLEADARHPEVEKSLSHMKVKLHTAVNPEGKDISYLYDRSSKEQ